MRSDIFSVLGTAAGTAGGLSYSLICALGVGVTRANW